MTAPDLFAMAESGLIVSLLGEWEISDHDDNVWGRAVVRGLKDGFLIADSVTPCQFSFRSGPEQDALGAMAIITWGNEASYASLERCGKDYLRWRLPEQEDGEPGEYTIWKRSTPVGGKGTPTRQSADQVAEEVLEARTRAAKEVANIRLEASEEIADEKYKAADHIAEACSKAAREVVDAREKAAMEIGELKELAQARAKVADDISEENESLKEQLSSQAGNSDFLREQIVRQADQVNQLKMLVMELMASTPKKKDADLNFAMPLKEEGTPDKESPSGKRRRVDDNEKENSPLPKENIPNLNTPLWRACLGQVA